MSEHQRPEPRTCEYCGKAMQRWPPHGCAEGDAAIRKILFGDAVKWDISRERQRPEPKPEPKPRRPKPRRPKPPAADSLRHAQLDSNPYAE